MTKAPQSSRKSQSGEKRRSSVAQLQTPRKSTKRRREEDPDDCDGGNTWDFDAPKFYDFGVAKTPGTTADRWFDRSHPTPAPRRSRGSRNSFLSFMSDDDRKDSLVPNRPSLSPSRVVAAADGKLRLDVDLGVDRQRIKVEDVEFSNSDEEVEFNKWKQAHAPAEDSSNNGSAQTTSPGGDTLSNDNNPASDSPQSETHDQGTSSLSAIPDVSEADARQLLNAVAKTKPAANAAHVGSERQLTVPVELGFMRPTRAVAHRLSVKKREKASKQYIATAIAKSINRTLADEKTSVLTIPKPFKFQELTKNGDSTIQSQTTRTKPTAKKNIKPLKKLQEELTSKPTTTPGHSEPAETAKERSENTISTQTPPKRTAKRFKPTVPKTPQFAKSKRIRIEKPNADTDDVERTRALGLTKPAVIQALHAMRMSPPKPTVVHPFTFRSDAAAERHLLKLRDEIAKLKAEEEALRQFRANPLPDFPTPKKPKSKPSNLHTSPFNLLTETRGEAYQRQLCERLEELESRQRERLLFKAQPIPHSLDHPFVPKQSTIPLTSIEEILLHTELRGEERREYDDDRKERERIREEVLARKRQEEERREDEEIKMLRKMLVHKAQPVRRYKPLAIKPSDRQPTVPKTPQWCVRTRKQPESAPTTPTH
ncbi:hypothetical protein EV175_004126 [Coemansia sp. RSA 1933]|nr:hypothetical protein EV175_004126 [Coemansia sp. RSA 1933]